MAQKYEKGASSEPARPEVGQFLQGLNMRV